MFGARIFLVAHVCFAVTATCNEIRVQLPLGEPEADKQQTRVHSSVPTCDGFRNACQNDGVQMDDGFQRCFLGYGPKALYCGNFVLEEINKIIGHWAWDIDFFVEETMGHAPQMSDRAAYIYRKTPTGLNASLEADGLLEAKALACTYLCKADVFLEKTPYSCMDGCYYVQMYSWSNGLMCPKAPGYYIQSYSWSNGLMFPKAPGYYIQQYSWSNGLMCPKALGDGPKASVFEACAGAVSYTHLRAHET